VEASITATAARAFIDAAQDASPDTHALTASGDGAVAGDSAPGVREAEPDGAEPDGVAVAVCEVSADGAGGGAVRDAETDGAGGVAVRDVEADTDGAREGGAGGTEAPPRSPATGATGTTGTAGGTGIVGARVSVNPGSEAA
jgi:hypothetical protein